MVAAACAAIVVALLAPTAAAHATAQATAQATPAPAPNAKKPAIVWKKIPFGPKRRRQMAAYSKRHYGVRTWRLRHPHVIVEHFTGGTSFSSAWNTFAANGPDLGELPGTCAHFIIDTDGTIYQLVPLGTRCRHTVGLNYTAIGIEDVGQSDAQVLDDAKQIASSYKLTLWLMQRLHIQLRNVIGHNESLISPYHKELYASWRCQTHSDWNHKDMRRYRKHLKVLARRHHVPIGPPPAWVDSGC